jgi:hypothetical protein
MSLPARQCPDEAQCLELLSDPGLAGSEACQAPAATLLAHRAAILAIANELHCPANEVARLYCSELQQLCGVASVADYLAVLIAKRVRARLMPGGDGPGPSGRAGH